MPGLSFLSKKSWHTSNISNQEKVWIAEQKAAAEEAKLKELTQQIKLEREQEELQKITGKKSSSTGDRGVDWMYEGHKKGEDDEERKKLEEDAQNEAYLLGKEYVPEGQTKHSGDFAVAASMTGALEKASTVGATIGVEAGGMNGGEGEEAGLRIQDETNTATAAAGSTMNEWNQNFHLRHEDPMFSVMQRKQAKDKDVEKKIKLMERAGMVVKEITKPTAAEKMQHDEQEDKNRERRRRKDSKKSSSKKKRKHKHNKSHRRHHKKRSRRERSSSPSSDDGYSTYSSSSSYSSEDSQRGRHRNDRRGGSKKRSSRRHYDDYERHHSSDRRRDRKRSESREGRRRDRSPERRDYDRYERHYKHESSERRRERSRSYSMDREGSRGERRSRGNDYRDYDGGDSRSSRRENDRDKYDDKKLPAEAAAAVAAPEGNTLPKKEGYGLIGTSLSNKGNNNNKSSPKPTSNGNGDYLGPDQKLREAKREEMERERQSRFGQGRKRRHGETSEERQIALEEMERNARDREKRWSK